MILATTKTLDGVYVDVAEGDGRRRQCRYTVFADGHPVATASTIAKAKRAANVLVGVPVFTVPGRAPIKEPRHVC